jgi:hypothetical protein
VTFAPVFEDGTDLAILEIQNDGGNARLMFASGVPAQARNLTVQVAGTTNYNGVFTPVDATPNSITIPVAFSGSDTGTATLSHTVEAADAYAMARTQLLASMEVGADGGRGDTGQVLVEERIERRDEMVTVFLATEWVPIGIHAAVRKLTPVWHASTPEEWPQNAGEPPTIFTCAAEVVVDREVAENDNPAALLPLIRGQVIEYLRAILPDGDAQGPVQSDAQGEISSGRLVITCSFLGRNTTIRSRAETQTRRRDKRYKSWWGGDAHYLQTSNEPDPVVVSKTVIQTHREGTAIVITPPTELDFAFVEVDTTDQTSDPTVLNNVGGFVTEQLTRTFVRYKLKGDVQ